MSSRTESPFKEFVLPWDSPSLITHTRNFQSSLDTGNCTWEDHDSLVDNTFSNSCSVNQNETVQNYNVPNKTTPVVNFPNVGDMQYWIAAAIVLIIVRRLFERYIFIPFGKHLGIKDGSKLQPISCSNPCVISFLENTYVSNKRKLSSDAINKLSLKTGLKSREIERWFRKRRAVDKPSTLIKFSESGWRCLCYILSTVIGFRTLHDKPWVWDNQLLWADYPNHDLQIEMWTYYLYGSGLYLSFLITQAFDVKRKDFWEMFVHHIVTLALLGLSWTLNFTRIGLFTLLLHDCADVFLEAAKMANYTKKQDLSTGIFVIFTLVWIVTRLIIYPKRLVIETTQSLLQIEHLPRFTVYSVVGLLIMLLCLHLFWTYFICKVAISVLKSGTENQKDSRSSTESDSSSNESHPKDNEDLRRKNSKTSAKRLSLQFESGAELLAMINTKQRAIMKRISVEIM